MNDKDAPRFIVRSCGHLCYRAPGTKYPPEHKRDHRPCVHCTGGTGCYLCEERNHTAHNEEEI